MGGQGASRTNRATVSAAAEQSPDERIVALAVERAKHGDRAAFAFLYSRFAEVVHRYAMSILRNPHDAEEVTQQVFTRLFATIDKYEQRDVPFLAWMLRVTRNAAFDHVRRRRSVPVAEVRVCDHRDALDQSGETADLIAALAQLPQDQREVLVLRHLAGLSPGEIAEHTGRTEGSVHGLHYRGRAALKADLKTRGRVPVTSLARSPEVRPTAG
ncbi:MAG TPA: sigma-70 family RNA polymerase sigma factor [Solirubrobacteraceae bacterium]|jgi:RNA polymerase sigma-70 factor (ECF subfamily)